MGFRDFDFRKQPPRKRARITDDEAAAIAAFKGPVTVGRTGYRTPTFAAEADSRVVLVGQGKIYARIWVR